MSQVPNKSPARLRLKDCVSAADKLDLVQLRCMRRKMRRKDSGHGGLCWLLKASTKKQLKAPLIFGQILFLQVSTQTSKARPEASRNSRRSEVRAKNLQGENEKWNKHMSRQNFSNPGNKEFRDA